MGHEQMPATNRNEAAGQNPDEPDVAEVIEIRDPEVDVEALMVRLRARVAERKAAGAYQDDLDALTGDLFSNRPAPTHVAPHVAVRDSLLRENLDEIGSLWILREMPFKSNAPVVGQAIVAVRTFWNWMSTKWYMRSILQQQTAFNGAVVQVLNQAILEQERLAAEVDRMTALVQEQQVQLDRLKPGHDT